MKRINRCLNTKLEEICNKAMQLEELTEKVNQYLPDFLRPHCQVSSFNRGCLQLATQDSVWATQLRFNLPDLRDKLRSEGKIYELASIKIIVTFHNQENTPRKQDSRALLSMKARDEIIREAEQCSYQPLKDALLQLAEKPEGCKLPSAVYEAGK